MSGKTLIIAGDNAADDVPRIPIFAVPRQIENPDYDPNEATPEGADPVPEYITELVTYDMPSEVNPVVGLEYGERSGENAAAASVWIIKEMLGEAAYRALTSEMKKMSPSKATSVFKQVADKIGSVALGN